MNNVTPVPDSAREAKPPKSKMIVRQATKEEMEKYKIGGDYVKLTEEKLRGYVNDGMTAPQIAEITGKTENCIRVYAHSKKITLNRSSGMRKPISKDDFDKKKKNCKILQRPEKTSKKQLKERRKK